MLLGYLLGLEEGKSSERERIESESRRQKEEQLTALKEQYMLGLLMPVRGQDSFKVVVRDTTLFKFSMVKELLKRIESPVKYFKYYTVGSTHVLEGYSTDTGEYDSYRKIELKQNALFSVVTISLLISAYFLNGYVLHLENKNLILLVLYIMFSISFPVTVGGLSTLLLIPQKDETIIGYDKL